MRLIVSFLLVVVFLTWSAPGCKQKSKTYLPTPTTIEGHFKGVKNTKVTFANTPVTQVDTDSTGYFRLSVTLQKSGVYSLRAGEASLLLFMIPGKHIRLSVTETTGQQKVDFTGDLANENNYLAAYQIQKDTFPSFFQDSAGVADEIAYTNIVESYIEQILTFQQTWQIEKGAFDDEFATIMLHEMAFLSAVKKMEYAIYVQKLPRDSVSPIADTYDSFLQNIDADNADHINIPSFEDFIRLYLTYKVTYDTIDTDLSMSRRKFNIITALFQSPELLSFAGFLVMKEAVISELNEVQVLLPEFEKMADDSYKKQIEELYITRLHLLPGNKAPDWIFLTEKNRKKTLSQLRGKVICMEIVAPGCIDCATEYALRKELQQRLTDTRNIIFVRVTLDTEAETENTAQPADRFAEFALHTDSTSYTSFIETYGITNFPRYILIDKKGIIINATAPMPSTGRFLQEINTALNQ